MSVRIVKAEARSLFVGEKEECGVKLELEDRTSCNVPDL
jgi:hypothetical protein